MNDTQTYENEEFNVQLSDIIEIISPTNDQLHESHFFIKYVNETRVELVNIASLEEVQLNKNEKGELSDTSIIEVNLVSRAEEQGYARQNNLLPGTWIEIHINGEISSILTGEITHLEEDQIEITLYPELQVIYIDFEYKGLPEDIPIDKFIIRDKPDALKEITTIVDLPENPITNSLTEEPSVNYLETGEVEIVAQENAQHEENVIENLQNMVRHSKGIVYQDLEDITQFIEIPDSQKKYDINIQTNSILDELLSTIPSSKRTPEIINKINVLIERYRELRSLFSKFDENGTVTTFIKRDPTLHKPIVENIKKMDRKINWFLPVVKRIRNVYDVETNEFDINTQPMVEVIQNEEKMKNDVYYNNNTVNDETKYVNYQRQLSSFMSSFENFDENTGLNMTEVRANIEAIVDNYDDFYSSVVSGSNILRKRFVVQTYNLGLNRLVERRQGSRNSTTIVNMTPPDKINIASFLMMPLRVVEYSRVELPGTSILDRSNINRQSMMIYRLLHKNKQIVPYIIDDLTKELDFEKDDVFLKDIIHFSLSNDVEKDEETLSKFLQTIIPKTRTLIRIIHKNVKNRLSFHSIVQCLEPFMIYTPDISYKQYLDIRYFIIEQIKERKSNMETKRKEFSFLTNARYNIQSASLSIVQLLLENRDLMELFITGYKLPEKGVIDSKYFSNEVLNLMMQKDNCILFTKLLSSLMSSLMTPDSLTDIFHSDETKIKDNNCNKRVLTKRYTSLEDLKKDNHTEVYYDTEFDRTPYHIINKYREQQNTMSAEKFSSYLSEVLVQIHNYSKDKTEEMVQLLIAGRKEVADGEYAIKEGEPNSYYYRKNNNWVHHEDVDENSFVDTKELFCNMEKKCFMNNKTDTCDSMKQTENRLKNETNKKIANEFDRRFEISKDEMKSKLETDIGEHIRYLHRKLRIQSIKTEKMNNYCYNLGTLKNDYENVIQSPHNELRDLILGQDNFVKKQHDIVKFYDSFCREPLETLQEHQHWKYCRDTNTKLLPGFLYDLAFCYITGGDYALKLEKICFTNGAKSESGNMIEDKYSGYMIRMIEYSDEEGYNEAGFKISTHAFIENDNQDDVLTDLLNPVVQPFICENPQTQLICDILTSIGKNIGLPIEDKKETLVRIAVSMCDKLIVDEDTYIKQAKKEEEKKGIKLPPYKKRSNQLTIMITSVVLFIIIQTEVPSFSIKYLMPGCIKSFNGYPLTGEEDTSGILYMSCILNKMKSTFEPWDSIKKMTSSMIFEQLKKIAGSALKNTLVDELYLKKREYLLLNPNIDIPQHHSISKWIHFLPPVVDTNIISGLRSIPKEFKDEFMNILKKGNKQQHHDFYVFQNKIAYYSYSIIESIQALVKDKTLILKTISTGVPFLQNACCNESLETPINYFIKENPHIETYLKTINNLSAIVKNVVELSKAPMLYDPRSTGTSYPIVKRTIEESNIYASFIHYCGLNGKKEIPKEFHLFFTEIPIGYDPKSSSEEKIEFLKKNGKQFGEAQLHQLMNVVHKRNIVHKPEDPKSNPVEMMKDLLQLFETHESPVIDENLRENLLQVLETYDKTKLTSFDENENPNEKTRISASKKLKNELAKTIEEVFKPQVLAFFKKYGKMKRTEFQHLETFFQTYINNWDDDNLHKIASFVSSSIQLMTHIIPNIIINNTSSNNRFPKTFENLSIYDQLKINESQTSNFNDFEQFKQDNVLTLLLYSIKNKTIDLQLFLRTIPIQEPIMKNGKEFFSLFDKSTIKLLMEYIFLSVIHEYIIATNDEELLRTDMIEKKKTAQELILERQDISLQLQTELLDINEQNESYDEINEIQIQIGNKEELKTKCAKLMINMINNISSHKKRVDMSYTTISNNIRKKKEIEKNRIVRRFENLSKNEVEIEKMRKKYKLDEWNVGQQRGLFVYDAKVSDRERIEQEDEIMIETDKYGQQPDDVEDEEDIEDDDMGFNMGSLKKNFFDGEYYSDDESDNEFGDEA